LPLSFFEEEGVFSLLLLLLLLARSTGYLRMLKHARGPGAGDDDAAVASPSMNVAAAAARDRCPPCARSHPRRRAPQPPSGAAVCPGCTGGRTGVFRASSAAQQRKREEKSPPSATRESAMVVVLSRKITPLGKIKTSLRIPPPGKI